MSRLHVSHLRDILFMGMHLMGVYLVGAYLMGMHLMGMHLRRVKLGASINDTFGAIFRGEIKR